MKIKSVLLTTLALCAYSTASASELRGDVDILLTIGEGCAVNGQTVSGANQFGSVNFGEHSSLNLFVDAESSGATSSSIQLTCNSDLAYSISLDDGQNSNASQRRVQRGGMDFVNYELYQDASRSVRWGSGGQARALTGSGSAQPIIVYGRVLAGQATPAAGNYVDTVRMTISW